MNDFFHVALMVSCLTISRTRTGGRTQLKC
jgi:hypothetical protein